MLDDVFIDIQDDGEFPMVLNIVEKALLASKSSNNNAKYVLSQLMTIVSNVKDQQPQLV